MMDLRILFILFLAMFCNVVFGREYLVSVATKKDAYAGTDSKVYVTMYGSGGESGELELKKSQTYPDDPFEKGHVDKFSFTFKDIGTIYKLKIKHHVLRLDVWPEWYLDYVVISSPNLLTDSSKFECSCKLDDSQEIIMKKCPPGYAATQQTKGICKDVNECLQSICIDPNAKCVNLDPGFRCECPLGYEMPQGKVNEYCTDKLECSHNQGGCSQICSEKPGSYECSCHPGYVLGNDLKTCNDVDECAASPDLCPSPSQCVNNIGSYSCECRPGYKKVNGICEDVDECSLTSYNYCDYVVSTCINLPGSYECPCKDGYKNKTPRTCQDINECTLNTHKCNTSTSTCKNSIGDYSCNCLSGYHQESNTKICLPDKCVPLSAPTGGIFSSPLCQGPESIVFQTTCTVNCINGYEPVDPTKMAITCLAGGKWSGSIPLCKPVTCPALSSPGNGTLWPIECATTGAVFNRRCTYICDNGYNLVGHAVRLCQPDQTYSGHPPTCEKVIAKPWIQCPSNIAKGLPSGKREVDLSSQWTLPISNVDQSRLSYQINPPAKNFIFIYGKHKVTWTATNEKGEIAKCSYTINILDSESPKVANCPKDAIKLLTTDSSIKVTWPALQFTDNVGTGSPIGTHHNGQEFSLGTHNVEIYVEDPAGNRATCAFKIIIKKKGCAHLEGPVNGQKFCQQFNTDIFCTITCSGGKILFTGTSSFGAYWSCSSGKWLPLDYVPDCIDFSNYVQGQDCPKGKVIIDTYVNHSPVKVCANCPTGKYYLQGKCIDCSKGTYQDIEGQEHCKPCPVGKSSYEGAKNLTRDCLDQCRFGEFSPTGFQPCLHCDRNSYQDQYGQTQCKPCPVGMETGIVGATSKDKCGTAPKIDSIQPKLATKTEGDSVVFECYISGTPYPTVTWKNLQADSVSSDFLGKEIMQAIKNSKGVNIGSRLTITGLTVHNTGQYECLLANRHGSVSQMVSLTVTPDISSSGSTPGFL